MASTENPEHSTGPDGVGDDRLPLGFELRFSEGRAFISAAGRPLGEGVVARRFAMEIPHVKFPFDVTGGAERFRNQRCTLRELDIALDAELLDRWLRERLADPALGIQNLELFPRAGFLEIRGEQGVAGPFTAKIGLLPEGRELALHLYDLRFYRSGPLCAAELLQRMVAEPLRHGFALLSAGSPTHLRVDLLGLVLQRLLAGRGFKIPDVRGVELRSATVAQGQVLLGFAAPDAPLSAPLPEQLTVLDGERSLAPVEKLITEGQLAKARRELLAQPPEGAHPLAAERLLQLLACDPSERELALDLCALYRRREPPFLPALWVEASLREAEGDRRAAATSLLALGEAALSHGELFSAAAAARQAARLAEDESAKVDDDLAARAYTLWENAAPQDVEALSGLADVAERQGDLPAALSALRRVAAYGDGTQTAASAHARLGRLLLEKTDDVVRARLHLDQALRQEPEQRATILALAEACLRSGEPMRAIRLLDQAADLAERDGELTEAVNHRMRSGQVWEDKLLRPENAVLRYRDAAELARRTGLAQLELLAITLLASACQKLGLWTEALEAQRLLSERAAPGRARAEALLAQARLLAMNLLDKEAADRMCARALREDPEFLEAALELCALRRGGPPAPLLEALTAAAELAPAKWSDPLARAGLLAERGTLELAELHDDAAALRAFVEALQIDPYCQPALSGAAQIAERQGRNAEAATYLETLCKLQVGEARRDTIVRIAALAERLDDPQAAARALAQAAADDQAPLSVLVRLLAVQRRQGLWAQADELVLRVSERAEAEGDPALAAEVLIAQLDDISDPARAVAASRMAARLDQLLPGNAFSRWAKVRLARMAKDAASLRESLIELIPLLPEQSATPGSAQAGARLPALATVQRELAEVSVALGRLAEAAEAYREVCRLEPFDEEAWVALGELQGLLGRPDEEAHSLERVAALLSRRGERIAASARLIQAARLLRERDPRAALQDLKTACESPRASSEALAELATLAEELGDVGTAARAIVRCAPTLPTARERARLFRRAAFLSADAHEAEDAARLAAEADPSFPWGRVVAAAAAIEAGEAIAARDLLAPMLSSEGEADSDPLEPFEEAFAEGLAWAAARERGDVAEERVALARLWERDPDDLSLLRRRVELWRSDAEFEPELLRGLRELAPRIPDDEAAEALSELGERLAERGEPALAEQSFMAALRRAEANPRALIGALRILPFEVEARRVLLAQLLSRPEELVLLGVPAEELGRLWSEYAARLEQDSHEALAAWKAASEADADDLQAPERWAELLEAAGKHIEAAEVHRLLFERRLRALAPTAWAAALRGAELLQGADRLEESESLLAAALQHGPPPDEALRLLLFLAQVQQRAGHALPEAETLAQAVLLSPAERRADLQMRRAEILRQTGDREGERAALQQAVISRPRDLPLLRPLAEVQLALEDYEGAIETLEQTALALLPDRPAAATVEVQRGVLAQDRLGHGSVAEAAYRRALILDPEQLEARRRLGELLVGRADADAVAAGLGLLGDALHRSQASPDEFAALARRAHGQLGHSDFALSLVRPFLAQEDAPESAQLLGAELLYLGGSVAEALPLLRRLSRRPFPDDPEIHERLTLYAAEASAQQGEVEEGLADLERFLTERPENRRAFGLYRELLRGTPAPAAAERLLRLAPALETSLATMATGVAAELLLESQPQRAMQLFSELGEHGDRSGLRTALAKIGDLAGLREAIDQDLARARAASDEAAEMDALRALVELHEVQNNGAEEAGALGQLVALLAKTDRHDEEILTRSVLGELLEREGEGERALSVYLEGSSREGGTKLIAPAEALARTLGRWPVLAELLARKLELASSPEVRAHRVDWALELAALYEGPLGDLERAEQTLRRAFDADEENLRLGEKLSEVYERFERWGNLGELQLRRARVAEIEGRPARAGELYGSAGVNLLRGGDAQSREAGLAALLKSLEFSRDPERLLLAADGLYEKGERVTAAEFYREVCEKSSPPFRALERLAAVERERVDPMTLGSFLARHAAEAEFPARWFLEASRSFALAGASEDRARAARAAFEFDPQSDAALAAVISTADFPTAERWVELLRRRAAAVPGERLLLFAKAGELLLAYGRADESAALFAEAVAIGPEDPTALAGWLEALWAQRVEGEVSELDGVAERLARVLRSAPISPANAEASLRLGVIELARGRYTEARWAYEIAAQSSPLLRKSEGVLRAQEVIHGRLGLRELQLTSRVDLYRAHRAAQVMAPQAMAAELDGVLALLQPSDPHASDLLLDAWELEAAPRGMALARRRAEALAAAERWNELADWLLRLLEEPLSPPLEAAQRVRLSLWAADVLAQRLMDWPGAERARHQALQDTGGQVELLREVERSVRQGDPALWVDVLGLLAEQTSEPERSTLLFERAKAADALLSPERALTAWEEVLRQGPAAPGYLQALERRLQGALTQGRFEDAVDSLLAEADAAVEPQARASLLQRAAHLREERLQDVEGAIELYRRSAAEAGDEKGFTLLAEAYDRHGRPAEAAAAMAVEITRREPGERKRERQRKLGLILAHELASPKEALPHLGAALVGSEDDAELLAALAGCARAVGDAALELDALSRLTGEDPGRARELRRAELLRAMGRDAEAVECLSRILTVDPANDPAFVELSALLEERKGWRELVGCLLDRAEALAGLGDQAQVVTERTALLVRRGDLLRGQLDDVDTAEGAYRAALELDPDHPAARAALRSIFDARGDTAASVILLQQEWDAIPAAERTAAMGLRLGRLRLTLGEFETARAVLEQVVEMAGAEGDDCNLVAAQGFLVRAMLEVGQPQDALALLNDAERHWSAELIPEVWALMGRAKLALGQHDDAVELFRRSLSMQPGLGDALEGLTAAGNAGSPALAAEALRHRLAADGDAAVKAPLWRSLADLQLSALDDRVGAEESLRAAATLQPDDDGTFDRLRELLEPEGRLEEMAEILRQRARGMKEDLARARVLCELGDLFRSRLRDAERAVDSYQRSLELVPRNPVATEGLAESLVVLGRDEEAALLYRRTLSGGGHLGEFFLHFRLGEIARRAGDGTQALEHFQKSVKQNPSFLPAGDALVAVAEETGAAEVGLGALRARVALLDPQEFVDQVAEAYLKIADIEKRALHFEGALEALEQAVRLRPGDRRALELLAAMYQNRSRWPEAVHVLVLLADLSEGPSRSSALVAAAEIALDKLADMERAEALFERTLQATPGQERATRRLAEIAAALGRHDKLAAIADAYHVTSGRPVPGWMEELWVPLAEAYERQGRLEDAYTVIGRANQKSPGDPSVLQRQAELARKLGRLGDESNLEENLIRQIAEERPLEAATRLRALARSVLQRLDDSARAEALLVQAEQMAPPRPEDRRMLADLQRGHPEGRAAALATYLDLVREDPTRDLVLLRVLAATAESVDRPELAQTARGLAMALEGTGVATAPTVTPFDPRSWSLGSLAAATSLEIAMQSLAPYLEPLFPAQLHRFGVTLADRVDAGHAAELHQWIERVRESLGARPIDVYLAAGTRGVAVENTQPPSLVIGGEAFEALGQAGMQFLVCQRLALIELGLTLPAKFSPRDVTTLATLVTLFISDDPSLLPAERRRLAPFLDALQQTCPEPVRAGMGVHASEAVRELERFDPHGYIRSGAARAHRIALLVTGDLSTGLHVFGYLDGGDSAAANRPWELPQGLALIAWAFSDEHLALRRAALGKPALEERA